MIKRFLLGLASLCMVAAPATAQIVARFPIINDGSGTITTGGTSQTALPGNASRAWLTCQNPITATETLFVNISASASTTAGSLELAPGGTLGFFGGVVPTGQVNVTAATTAHRFVCKEG